MSIGKVFSQSAVILAARLGGALAMIAMQAAMVRAWSASILGDYLLIVAIVNLLATAMPLGFQTIGTYFTSEYRVRGNGIELRKFLWRSYAHVVATTLLLMLAAMALASFGFGIDRLRGTEIPVTLLACATAIVFLNGAILVGMRRPVAGLIADTLFRPLLMIAGFLLALHFASAASLLPAMLWIAAIGYMAVALIHLTYVIKAVRKVESPQRETRGEARRWWRFALPWVLIALTTDFFFDIDLVLLARLLGREDLAVFGICVRVISLVAFGVSAVYTVTMPEFMEAEIRNDRAEFHRKVGHANLIATLLGLITAAAALVSEPLFVWVFGPAFTGSSPVLAILCVALAVRAMLGPALLVLSMHDMPYAGLPAAALGIAILIAANIAMVPVFGVMGAGLAAFAAIATWSAASWLTAYRLLHIDVSIFGHHRRTMGAESRPAVSA